MYGMAEVSRNKFQILCLLASPDGKRRFRRALDARLHEYGMVDQGREQSLLSDCGDGHYVVL